MKAVIFDFDGTLTLKNQNIWIAIWQKLGYGTGEGSYFRELFSKYLNGEITHQEWSDLTCEAFRAKNLTREKLKIISNEMKLKPGFDNTMYQLVSRGYQLHIVSGNIIESMEHVLSGKNKYFTSINANRFSFDKDGNLTKILATKYDFEGKRDFVKNFIEKFNANPKDIVFVGNGDNDEWVHESGCRTICINPEKTDPSNKKVWHDSIPDLENLTELINIIDRSHNELTTCVAGSIN